MKKIDACKDVETLLKLNFATKEDTLVVLKFILTNFDNFINTSSGITSKNFKK